MPAESKTLRALARRFKGRLSSCLAFDGNVCDYRAVPGRPWELVAVSGEPFFQKLTFTCRERRVVLLANNSYVHGAFHGTFANGPLSINTELDLVELDSAGTVTMADTRYPVFTQDGRISPSQAELLENPGVVSLVADSSLKTGEMFYFMRGEMGFYLKQSDPDLVGKVVELMNDLVRSRHVDPEPLSLDVLPSQFHPLISLIQRWGVDDDLDREELLDTTPKPVLRSLVDEVSPYLKAIDSFLDSFRGGVLSEEAAALGRLAECVVEARTLL